MSNVLRIQDYTRRATSADYLSHIARRNLLRPEWSKPVPISQPLPFAKQAIKYSILLNELHEERRSTIGELRNLLRGSGSNLSVSFIKYGTILPEISLTEEQLRLYRIIQSVEAGIETFHTKWVKLERGSELKGA